MSGNRRGLDSRWRLAVTVLLLFPGAALANNNPGPQTLFGFVAMLIAIPILTYAGGGERILKRVAPASRWMRGIWSLLKVIAVLLFFLWIGTAGTSGLALLAVLAFAVFRGARLIAWGVKAGLPDAARPAHVEGGSRWRLITAGSLLIVTAFVLTHMSVAFVGYYPPEYRLASDLKKLATAMKEAGEKNKGPDGLPRYTPPTLSSSGSYQFSDKWYHTLRPEPGARYSWHATEVKVAADGKSFQVWTWPREVPYRPWNQIMPVASFYIDQTGQLRATRVSEAGTRCPPDAPVRDVAGG